MKKNRHRRNRQPDIGADLIAGLMALCLGVSILLGSLLVYSTFISPDGPIAKALGVSTVHSPQSTVHSPSARIP